MEKDLALGPETKTALSIAGGKVRIQIDYVGKQATAGSFVELSIDQYAAMLKAAIPGPIDDAIIDVLVAAMKVV